MVPKEEEDPFCPRIKVLKVPSILKKFGQKTVVKNHLFTVGLFKKHLKEIYL